MLVLFDGTKDDEPANPTSCESPPLSVESEHFDDFLESRPEDCEALAAFATQVEPGFIPSHCQPRRYAKSSSPTRSSSPAHDTYRVPA